MPRIIYHRFTFYLRKTFQCKSPNYKDIIMQPATKNLSGDPFLCFLYYMPRYDCQDPHKWKTSSFKKVIYSEDLSAPAVSRRSGSVILSFKCASMQHNTQLCIRISHIKRLVPVQILIKCESRSEQSAFRNRLLTAGDKWHGRHF